MVTGKKAYGKAMTMPAGLAVGVGIGLLITIIGAMILTQMILGEKIQESAIGYGAMTVVPIAAAVGALVAVGLIKRRRMQVSLVTGGLYFLVLLIINILFFGGQFQGILVTALLVILGSGGVGLLGLRTGERRGRHRKKYRSR